MCHKVPKYVHANDARNSHVSLLFWILLHIYMRLAPYTPHWSPDNQTLGSPIHFCINSKQLSNTWLVTGWPQASDEADWRCINADISTPVLSPCWLNMGPMSPGHQHPWLPFSILVTAATCVARLATVLSNISTITVIQWGLEAAFIVTLPSFHYQGGLF